MLNLLTFSEMVQRFAAQARASAGTVLNFSVGSIWRAIAEANAALGLWIQWLILLVLQQSRLATSAGDQVDTWVADFGLTRLPAVASSGAVTFSRYTPTLAAFVPVGTQLKSSDGTQLFTVVADGTNPAYVLTPASGYNIAPSAASLTVAAAATVGGTATNVQPGAISVLASGIAGVDTVSNTLAFSGGLDAEPDAALKVRFALYIQGLSKGTAAAVGFAVVSVRQGLSYTILTAQDTLGHASPGNFVVVLDDGTGAPSTTLRDQVYVAVDAVRAVGSTFSVIAPTITTVAVIMTVTPTPGYAKASVQAAISTAVTGYINTLPVGTSLYYTSLARVAMDASAGVGTITGLLINSSQADVIIPSVGIVKVSTVAVN